MSEIEKALLELVGKKVNNICREEEIRMVAQIDKAYQEAKATMRKRLEDEIPELAVKLYTSVDYERFREKLDTYIKVIFQNK